jgi:hypothetical protein
MELLKVTHPLFEQVPDALKASARNDRLLAAGGVDETV